jgi:hypothetical protein
MVKRKDTASEEACARTTYRAVILWLEKIIRGYLVERKIQICRIMDYDPDAVLF